MAAVFERPATSADTGVHAVGCSAWPACDALRDVAAYRAEAMRLRQEARRDIPLAILRAARRVFIR